MMNSHSAALRLTVNAYQSTLDKDVLDAMTAAADEIDRLEQEHEATKLRLDAANESITGCAQRVQSLSFKLHKRTEALRNLKAEASGLAAFSEDIREIIGNTNMTVLEQRIKEAEEAMRDE